MKWMHAVLVAVNGGVLPPEPLLIDRDHHLERPLVLQDHAALDIQAGHSLTLTGPLDGVRADPSNWSPGHTLYKLGDGHLALQADSERSGRTTVLRGSLGLASDHALGADSNELTLVGGTRLELANGVNVAHPISALEADPPDHTLRAWGITPQALAAPVTLRVEQGEATLSGFLLGYTALAKDGAGTLRLTGVGYQGQGGPLVVREGGLRVDGAWVGDAIHTRPGTVLSGTGYIDQAVVAGHLQPGSPEATGTLLFGESLHLGPSAQTRIRVDAAGDADALSAWGSARLAGDLLVDLAPGAWTPQDRWVIVEAEEGLAAESRYASARSNIPYLDPVLAYAPTSVTLGLRYNRLGLNTVDGAWRSALVEDSRFLRESALSHSASRGAWIQTWAAHAERPGQARQPGDGRDTTGLQIGVNLPLGAASSGDALEAPRGWQLSAFAGSQAINLGSEPPAAYGTRDSSVHAGLAASGIVGRGLRLTAGAAHSWHNARLQRQVYPREPRLASHAHAGLSQLWLDARADSPLPVGAWGLTPHAGVAWLRLNRPGFEETGSLAAVTLQDRREDRWTTHVGLQARRGWDTPQGDIQFAAGVGLYSQWGPCTLQSPQAYRADPTKVFDVASPVLTRHALSLDIAVDVPLARRARMSLAYGGRLDGQRDQHGVWLGVGAGF